MMLEVTGRVRRTRRARGLLGGLTGLVALSLAGAAGCGKGPDSASATPQVAKTEPSPTTSTGFPATAAGKAIVQAGKDGKYSFVLLYRPNEQASEAMRATFARAEGKLRAKAALLSVDVEAKSEAPLMEKLGAQQAPVPLTLVVAPNGAMVRAFTQPVDEKALAGAFVSSAVATTAKALQEKKVVALCLQGPATKHNRESKGAAQQFVADPKLGGRAVLIAADPSQEAELLRRCGMKAVSKEATVVLLAPPGKMVASVEGATTKDALLQKFTSASSSCSSGSCGPSGCN